MKIAKSLGPISDDLSVFSPSVLSVLADASAPLRQEIIAHVKSGEPVPTAKQVRQRMKAENKKSHEAPSSPPPEDSNALEHATPGVDEGRSDEYDATSLAPSMAPDETTDDAWMSELQVQEADKAAAFIVDKLESYQSGTTRALRAMIRDIDPEILGAAVKRTLARQEEVDKAEIDDSIMS